VRLLYCSRVLLLYSKWTVYIRSFVLRYQKHTDAKIFGEAGFLIIRIFSPTLYRTDGAELVAINMMNALKQEGSNVTVFVNKKINPKNAERVSRIANKFDESQISKKSIEVMNSCVERKKNRRACIRWRSDDPS
jgi:hypothetical protein